MGTAGELKIANYLLAVEGFAMIRSVLTDPSRLEALPVETASVDLVVCGLALTHVEDLTPVFGWWMSRWWRASRASPRSRTRRAKRFSAGRTC